MNRSRRASGRCPDLPDLLARAARKAAGGLPAMDESNWCDAHLLHCARCRREWNEILQDRRESERSNLAVFRSKRRVPNFRMREGLLSALENFPFHTIGPVFRSRGGTVIHSSIVALDEDYVLLEVVGQPAGLRLNLEKGRKKGGEIRISLYTDRYLSDSILLRDRFSWDLNSFIPGDYRLKLDGKTVLKFNIQE